jgi:Tol biopolymer transport system component
LLLAVAVWLRWHPREIELAPPRLMTLTSMRGLVTHPTFSPDGGQIAFAWEGEKGDNWDIYLKMIGSSEFRRLTTDPAPDFAPSWSPDGRQIASFALTLGTSRGTSRARARSTWFRPLAGLTGN